MCRKGWLAANAERASRGNGSLGNSGSLGNCKPPGNGELYGNLAKHTLRSIFF